MIQIPLPKDFNKEELLFDAKILGKVKIKKLPPVLGLGSLKEGDIVDITKESERGVWIKGEEPTEKLRKMDSTYKGEILLLFGEFESVE